MTTTVETTVLHPIAAQPGAERVSADEVHPYRAGLRIALCGYAVLTVVLLALGWLLTHPLNSSIGRWDEHVNEYLVRHRTDRLNGITGVATAAFNTFPVIGAA